MAENEKFWMVYNPRKGVPTIRHLTKGLALIEAQRIAQVEPGDKVYILESIEYVWFEVLPAKLVVL